MFCIAIRSSNNSSEALRNQAYLGPASTQAEMSCTLVGGSFICQVTKWAPNISAADSASPGSIQVGFSLGKQGSYWVNINQYTSETSSWPVLFVRKTTTSFLCPQLSTDGGKAHRVLINENYWIVSKTPSAGCPVKSACFLVKLLLSSPIRQLGSLSPSKLFFKLQSGLVQWLTSLISGAQTTEGCLGP